MRLPSLKRVAIGLVAGIAALLLVVGCQMVRHSRGIDRVPLPAGDLRIASYNVHYILSNKKQGAWGTDHWQQRKAPLDSVFKSLSADVIAFQEMETFAGGNDDSVNLTREWLLSNNPGYRAAAVGPWQQFPSTQPVFYLQDKIELLDQGWFFFSETPDVIYSRTFNGSFPAFASWAQLKSKSTGDAFKVVNVHLDFSSRENRKRSTDLIASRIAPWIQNGESVFLAGDLNARHRSQLHKTLNSAGLEFIPVAGSTFHFNRGFNLFGAIDHIGYSADIRHVGESVVVRDKAGDVWPTDHYPLVADFMF